MISLADAYEKITQAVGSARLAIETIKVIDAFQHIVAAPLSSKLDLPPFNKSAMDGFAVCTDDIREFYQLIEVVPAGQVPRKKLQPGTTIQVMTGSPVPDGSGQVIPVELAELDGERVRVCAEKSVQKHICAKGEDVKSGTEIMAAGRTLDPLAIANLIACGITEVKVYKKPRCAIFSTGDEIVDDFSQLSAGKIIDSNGPLLKTLCNKNGFEVNYYGRVKDDLAATCRELEKALTVADVVLFSGGVSMGEFDYVAKAFQELGLTTHFTKVAIKPGKPTTFATGKNKMVFGLPGNPVAVYLTFHLFVKQTIKLLCGGEIIENSVELPLEKSFQRKNIERAAYIPCQLLSSGKLAPVFYNGSAHMLALLQADGFFIVPAGVEKIATGALVNFLRL